MSDTCVLSSYHDSQKGTFYLNVYITGLRKNRAVCSQYSQCPRHQNAYAACAPIAMYC